MKVFFLAHGMQIVMEIVISTIESIETTLLLGILATKELKNTANIEP